MTRQRDIGRVLDAWLAPGPVEAPDRVLDILADRIAEVPQRRHPRAHTRFHAMTPPTLKFAAAAAILLAIGLAVVPLVNTGPNVASSPSPSASAEPTAVPEQMRFTWIAGPRSDETSYVDVRLEVDDGSVQIWTSRNFQLGNRAVLAADDTLRLQSFRGVTGCDGAETADYAWSLAPGGASLTLTPSSDPCPDRVDALARTFQRIDCDNPDDPCPGVLGAGTYHSIEFAPGAFPNGRPVGGLTYTVPDGWAAFMDGPSNFGLAPTDEYTSGRVYESVAISGITIGSRVAATSQAESCPVNSEEPGVGRTVEDLVAWVGAHPGLVASAPEAITLDGRPAVMIDVELAPTWTRGCPDWGVTEPFVLLTTEYGARDDYLWAVGLGSDGTPAPNRLIFVDLGNGQVVHLWVAAAQASDFETFLKEAMPIVESMRFRP